jgi:hypothetical protein
VDVCGVGVDLIQTCELFAGGCNLVGVCPN